MLPSRRHFLQATLGSSALVSCGLSVPQFLARSALAAEVQAKGTKGRGAKDNVLVVVQLAGGNDGLNTVIPFADDGYARNRFALRVPTEQMLKIDGHVALHPQLKDLRKLIESQRVAIVQGVGYPNPDRSHFRSMDIWNSAQRNVEHPRDGWLGRTLEHGRHQAGFDVPALHLGSEELPLALASRQLAVPSVESMDSFRLRTSDGSVPLSTLKTLAEIRRPDASPLLDFLCRSTLNAYAASQQVQQALVEGKTATPYPENFGLAKKLKTIAQLIDAGLGTRIYYVSLAGFDTHANQAQSHSNLLRELSESLSAFVADLAARGHLDRVLVLSFSEFGRRVRENASQGTDHGTAAPVFLAGGKVQAGLIGKHPSLSDLDQGDLKFHTDFRSVYAAILDGWLGCPSQTVLGQKFSPAGILRA
jgi:uncharacterized protein (DUF1501 family)